LLPIIETVVIITIKTAKEKSQKLLMETACAGKVLDNWKQAATGSLSGQHHAVKGNILVLLFITKALCHWQPIAMCDQPALCHL